MQGKGGAQRLGHVAALDGVRGLAVLLVVVFHLGKLLQLDQLVPGGFIGVDLFFVLSGFLIASLLFDEHSRRCDISLRRFYARRACRLLPALYVYLIAHLAYSLYRDFSLEEELRAIAAIVLYVPNIVQSGGDLFPRALIHTWSLGVEEQFYLVCPFLLLLVLRARLQPRTIALVLFAGAAASAVIRVWIFRNGGGYAGAYMLPQARFDGLLIGMGVAQLWRHRLLPRAALPVAGSLGLVTLLAIAMVTQSDATWLFYGGYTLVAVAAVAVIAAVADGAWRVRTVFDVTALRAVGRVSYGLYLWHALVILMVSEHLADASRAAQASAVLLGSAAATAASWFVVETPFLQLKQRWSTAPASATPAATAAAD